MKTLSLLLILAVALGFNGCCDKTPIIKTEYTKVFVPVSCVIEPIKCDLDVNDVSYIANLDWCLTKYEKAIKTCQ